MLQTFLMEIVKQLNLNLEHHLKQHTPNHSIREIYQYAVIPAGKLFRPLLAWAIASDMKGSTIDQLPANSDLAYLASALEIHHAYTLIHDDLPCMDDDDFRRNKPATHKKFGEGMALLAGDGLLNLSYRLLSQIKSPNLPILLKFFSWALGTKGLIQGQALDLGDEMCNDFETLIQTHKLKTARLIQISLLGSSILIENFKELPDKRYTVQKNIFRLGHNLGIVFQLLDDLTELTESSIGTHERSINPWFNFHEETSRELLGRLNSLHSTLERYRLQNISDVINQYFGKMLLKIQEGSEEIINNFSKVGVSTESLDPIIITLDRINSGK